VIKFCAALCAVAGVAGETLKKAAKQNAERPVQYAFFPGVPAHSSSVRVNTPRVCAFDAGQEQQQLARMEVMNVEWPHCVGSLRQSIQGVTMRQVERNHFTCESLHPPPADSAPLRE
jgi:hypothetical protein